MISDRELSLQAKTKSCIIQLILSFIFRRQALQLT